MQSKSTLALAVGAACAVLAGVAGAQTRVELYGSVDAGVSYVNDARGKGQATVDSGNRSPDRFGFRGSEDLGGGYKALFGIESGFNLDTGTQKNPNKLFQRRTFVGLSGPIGTVSLGHMPDFMYDYLRFQSNGIMGSAYFFHPGNLDNQANQFQIDNAVRYETPTLRGFKFGAMVGFGEQPESSVKGRHYSLGAQYANGPLKANLAFTKSRDRALNLGATMGLSSVLGQTLSADPSAPDAKYTNFNADRMTSFGATGSYTIGRFTLHAMISTVKLENRIGSETQRNVELGTDYALTPSNTLGVSVATSKFGDVRWDQFNVINMFRFSKRTTLYGAIAWQKAKNGVAVINSLAPSSTDKQMVSRIGIHHLF